MWISRLSSNERMKKTALNYKLNELFQRPAIIKKKTGQDVCVKSLGLFNEYNRQGEAYL